MARKNQYKFGEDFNFQEDDTLFKRAGRFIIGAVAVSLALTLVLYGLFALTFNTDKEATLKREIRMYQRVYPKLLPQQELLDGSIIALENKDNAIYGKVFQSTAPEVDPVKSLDFFYGSDTLPDTRIIAYSYAKSTKLVEQSARVEAKFREILSKASSSEFITPPMLMPVRDIAYPQIGAGPGVKVNPFLRAPVQHNGLDFIVPQGEPVFAAADGYVGGIEKNAKGSGNKITIYHKGGYTTSYSHLSTIYVREGQRVKKGAKIALVGMSGSSYAPHLHYEVRNGSAYLNPVNYLFASVGVDEYANMVYMSVNTKQSLD